MKVLNVTLSIVILLLAAASAVSSYFLFMKRSQLAEGWKKLTIAINQAATIMDTKSGTNYKTELSTEALHHDNYSNLEAKLGQLKNQATNLTAQRDALAEAVRQVAITVEAANVQPIDAYTEIAKQKDSTADSLNALGAFKNRRDKLVNDIVASAKRMNLTMNPADLKGDKSDAAFRAFDAKIAAIRGQFDAYQAAMRDAAKVAGAPNPDFSDAKFADSLKQINAAVRELKSKYDNTLAKLDKAANDLKASEATVKQRDGQIAALNATIAAKDTDIRQYRKALGLPDDTEFSPWQPGSPEARRAVRGAVVEVNGKFGFVAVNQGTDSVVEQQIGNKTTTVSPGFATGLIMVIARNMDSASVEYIGKIRLTNVDADCSIGEIIELAPDQTIKAGDAAFFLEGAPVSAEQPKAEVKEEVKAEAPAEAKAE